MASDDAIKIFSMAPLEGIENEEWQILWEAARSYSEKYAYPHRSFPVLDGFESDMINVLYEADSDGVDGDLWPRPQRELLVVSVILLRGSLESDGAGP